jgi:hypothetical protein
MSLRALAIPLAVTLLGSSRPAAAAPEMPPPGPIVPAPPDARDPLRVFVMTMGPGDHPFFRFGHNAIWIRDEAAITDRVYNFGTFRFDSPRLILDFLGGRLNYWLSVAPLPRVIAEYGHENRSVDVQELNLSPAEKLDLRTALDINARPENRLYKYDYFLDNCSTRVRDAIDRLVAGELHASARRPARMTLRDHALRMSAQPLWLYLALDIVLGPKVDEPIDRWAEMFLPGELARGLDVQVTRTGVIQAALSDGAGAGEPSAATRPLVRGQVELVHANRPPPLLVPPARTPKFLAWGVFTGLLLFALGWGASRSPWARVPFGIVVALWGLATGFIGSFLVYAWLMTDHVVAHRNQNILLCAPWALAHVVLGIGVSLGRPGATRKAFALAAAALGAVVVACLLKLGFVANQQNVPLIAFFLPAWVGITTALWWLRRSTREPSEGSHTLPR